MRILFCAAAALLAAEPICAATWVDYEIGVTADGTTTYGSYPYQTLGPEHYEGKISVVLNFDGDQSYLLPSSTGSSGVFSINDNSLSLFIGGIEEYHLDLSVVPGSQGAGPVPDFETASLISSSFSYSVNAHQFYQNLAGTVSTVTTSLLPSAPVGGARITIIGGAVPEPASWAMMIGGFGMIGAAMRRRKIASTFSRSTDRLERVAAVVVRSA